MNQFQPNPGTPKGDLRAIRILFYAIVLGAVVFSLMMLMITKGNGFPTPGVRQYENIILWIAAVIALVCLIASWNSYKKRLAIAKDSLISLQDKLNHYRTTLILYVALCEGPALFGTSLFFITGNHMFFIITGVMIVAILVKAPTLKRVTNDLAIDWQQQRELE